ncbi:MAG: hypothetical protein ABIM50_03710 [Novosphingobium sp.]
MEKKTSHLKTILQALPAAQKAVREQISERIKNGEKIARTEGDSIISQNPPSKALCSRRKAILGHQEFDATALDFLERKSVA